ncbi:MULTISPECIES: hypothetical protein [Nitrosomonas]|jgi:hypothetical protein|uniref:hypothetical protein n=1 Tax=Nitrosomonas TaxID=914 RepID=UPI001935A470|nr:MULTISPECIES: hypothetical protein [Nitrosomonas]QOJ09793.1 MAG: hypothetical protein HRU73_10240 [Nitrosomonas sp. H1_AOB3]HNR10264.1 hypothetical protein [Nitrosomonas europaea]HNS58995.1 hypothetical protein [Nitrosomonas europaea]HRN82161.1 hypothetical protein [Nitrosomonas europaea]HRO56230.1 hypothetical protein [Nitrosomonas europaea]
MKQSIFFLTALILFHASSNAGTLVNGTWSPMGCGERPVAPVVSAASVEDYNRSAEAINEWQKRAQQYNSCLVDEANADNALIARTANDQQAKFREEIDRINAETDKARAELDSKR